MRFLSWVRDGLARWSARLARRRSPALSEYRFTLAALKPRRWD